MNHSNNHYFSVSIRNDDTETIHVFTINTPATLDSAASLASQRANRMGWKRHTVLEVSERLIGPSQPKLDS